MGLKRFFARWSKGEDQRAVERAQEETGMTSSERDASQEDFEARKEDTKIAGDWIGSETLDSADES